jgi:hypothetical protein
MATTCRLSAVAAALVALAACAGPTQAPAVTPAASAPTMPSGSQGAATVPGEVVAQSVIDGLGAAPAVAAAARAFADELGVSASSVAVVDLAAVTWSDSSLGCPQPGQMYLQVLTPGYRITLASGETRATYHTDQGDGRSPNVVRCDAQYVISAFEPMPALELDQLTAGALDAARRDLARRVGSDVPLTLEDRRVAEVTELVCDGTPTPSAQGPAKVIIELQLKAGQQIHMYRAWHDEILYCGVVGGPVTQ